REEEAFEVVKKLHGKKDNEEFIKLEFAEMYVYRVEQIKSEKANYQTKAMLRRTLTGMAVQICCQFTVYAALGLSGPKVLLITGINGALGVI
ncbi:15573_t:CDS:2, partial [Acaulospora colombiana]